MISRVRVEARAASMEQAEREIGIVLAHFSAAGYLEGLVPQQSDTTDQHFGRVFGQMDGWHELGLHYEGRQVITYEPEITDGGLKSPGYQVLEVPIAESPDEGEAGYVRHDPNVAQVNFPIVSEKVIVLRREVPVTREHSWDGSSRALVGDGRSVHLLEMPAKEPTPENLERITKLATHENVTEFGFSRQPPGWGVQLAMFEQRPGSAMATGQSTGFYGQTLSEALDQAEEALRDFVGVPPPVPAA